MNRRTMLAGVVKWVSRWLERHQHPASLVLHAIAVPMLAVAGVLAVTQLVADEWSLWWRPVGLVLVSYFLQWIGHRVEGNDMGEVILVRKWLGKSYVAVAPRYTDPHCGTLPSDSKSP